MTEFGLFVPFWDQGALVFVPSFLLAPLIYSREIDAFLDIAELATFLSNYYYYYLYYYFV